MLRKSGGSVSLRQFGDGAGHFDAGRAGADDDESQQRRAPRRIGLALGALEGDQNAPPQRGGVLQRLQSRRERLPFVMAEIGVARAGGEHQRVVGHRVAVIEQHALAPSASTPLTVANSVVTSWRPRSRWRIGQAISDVASEAVAT